VGNKLQKIKLRYLKGILIVCFFLLTIKAAAPGYPVTFILMSKPVDAFEKLVNAIIQVESKGDTLAFNKIEKAIGAFQIRPIRLLDYNQRTGKKYKSEDCFDLKISKEIFLYYAINQGFPDYESIARNWNGSGKTTLDYWKKVKSFLQ